MIQLFSMEFWVVTLFTINFIFVVFLFLFVKKVNRLSDNFDRHQEFDRQQGFSNTNKAKNKDNNKDSDDSFKADRHASNSASNIIEMLEPLLKESKNVALSFDKQIKEKKKLIRELNDALDSRIIDINLLLSRADALRKKLEEKQNQPAPQQQPHLQQQEHPQPSQEQPHQPHLQQSQPQEHLQQRLQPQPQTAPQFNVPHSQGFDQQNHIIEMYQQDFNIDSIARKLSIPKGEVQLVIDLKTKFLAMEKNGR